jgi:hypothetical protein
MGVAMARIKLNADRLVGYMKTDSSETNASNFRRLIDFFDPAITDVLGPREWRVEDCSLPRIGVTPLVTLRNFWGQLRIRE